MGGGGGAPDWSDAERRAAAQLGLRAGERRGGAAEAEAEAEGGGGGGGIGAAEAEAEDASNASCFELSSRINATPSRSHFFKRCSLATSFA